MMMPMTQKPIIPSVVLYGIPNCDTVKKARDWLTAHDVAHSFHDFKKQGVPQPQINLWIAAVGWEKLVNGELLKVAERSGFDVLLTTETRTWSRSRI